MTKKSNLTIYFDANIYIAYYRQEIPSYGPDRIEAINEVWQENEKGGVTIMTSSLTICEVSTRLLQEGLTKEEDDFRNRFKFGMHTLFDVDPIVSEKAAQYRHFYRNNPIVRPRKITPFANLASPDAIHLATAVIYRADEFWTFDGLKEKKNKYRSIKLLWFNNKVAGDKLIVIAPSRPAHSSGQPSLFADEALKVVPMQPRILPRPAS